MWIRTQKVQKTLSIRISEPSTGQIFGIVRLIVRLNIREEGSEGTNGSLLQKDETFKYFGRFSI